MNEPPVPTSMVEVSHAAILCAVMTIASWLILFLALRTNLASALSSSNGKDPSNNLPPGLLQAARRWHCGIVSILTSLIPAAVLWVGLVSISYARDMGLVIIPWYIWIPFALWAAANSLSWWIRNSCLRKLANNSEIPS